MARRHTPLAAIRLLVLDVDGVLTDGRLCYGPDGEREKLFHVRDGFGIRTLAAAGVTIAVISGRDSAAVARRCAELGIRDVQQGSPTRRPRWPRCWRGCGSRRATAPASAMTRRTCR